jgi:hypothetical protein
MMIISMKIRRFQMDESVMATGAKLHAHTRHSPSRHSKLIRSTRLNRRMMMMMMMITMMMMTMMMMMMMSISPFDPMV